MNWREAAAYEQGLDSKMNVLRNGEDQGIVKEQVRHIELKEFMRTRASKQQEILGQLNKNHAQAKDAVEMVVETDLSKTRRQQTDNIDYCSWMICHDEDD